MISRTQGRSESLEARTTARCRTLAVQLRRTLTVYNTDNVASFGLAIAYTALLALVPLAVFTLALAGLVVQEPATQERVGRALLDHLPITTASGRAQLQDALRVIAQRRPALGLVSLLVAAYAARGIVVQLRTGLSVALKIARPRTLVRGVLVDLGMAVGLGLLLLLSLTLTLGIALVQTANAGLPGTPLPQPLIVLLTLLYAVTPLLVSVAVFAVLYTVVARGVLPWRAVLPGALLAALAFEVVKVGFAWYAAHVGSSTTMPGAIGVVIAFLALPHFGAQIALFGAVFARVCSEHGTTPPRAADIPRADPLSVKPVLSTAVATGQSPAPGAVARQPGLTGPPTDERPGG